MYWEQQRVIENTLIQLGIGESEIVIFMLGLEYGAMSIKQLSEESGMGRITVHEVVKRLLEKWLFLETRSGKRRMVYPNQLDALQWLVDRKRNEVMEMEQVAWQAIELLKDFQSQSSYFPKTRYYKWKEWMRQVVKEIKDDKNNVQILSDGQHFYDLIDNNFLEESLTWRKKYDITVSLLFPMGFEYFTYTQGTYQQELNIKSHDGIEASGIRGGLTIWWEKVWMHSYQGKYITTTIIEHPMISQLHKGMFELLWNQI